MQPEMSEFSEFIARIRDGDESAARELVSRYEPIVRREVRMRLLDPRLRRTLDSGDVCQSVLASFFVRATTGQYELDDPRALLTLLVTMARKKTAYAARRQYRLRRDARRYQGFADGEDHADRSAATPSETVAQDEILRCVEASLTVEERDIMMLRRDGCSWQEIAGRLGGTPNGRRMQIGRAADRICRQLGLNDG